MFKNIYLTLLFVPLLFICACGGGGNGAAAGNTVTLQASVKNATSLLALSSVSDVLFVSDGAIPPVFTPTVNNVTTEEILEFSIKSIAYPNVGTLVSDVLISTVNVSFEYQNNSDPLYTTKVILPPFTIATSGVITPGGTLDIKMPVIRASTKQYFRDNGYLTSFSNLPANQLNFIINLTFTGKELKTGNPLTVNTTANLALNNLIYTGI